MMITLFSLLFAFAAHANSDESLRFQYVPNEGGEILPCTHKRIRDLPDWEVICGDKSYVAHVVIQHYKHPEKTSIEILYWVTDRGEERPVFHSTTAWVNLKKPGEAASLSLSQGVENDYASLVMDWQNN